MIATLAIAWTHCPPDLLLWLRLREPLLQLLYQPWLLLPLVGGLSWWLTRPLPAFGRSAAIFACILLLALVYSPTGTDVLTAWLRQQTPRTKSYVLPDTAPAVVVLLGRGSQVATVATAAATSLLRSGVATAVYVSGDAISTAHSLERQGVPTDQIAGDSCARTTWENATRTAAWLHRHHPGAPVLLITDPWQLPRATAAFRRQGLAIKPISVEPGLTSSERSRFALRETAGTLLYGLQGRL